MKQAARSALFALVLIGLSGCGPESALYLRIEAPLRVPEDCDEVKVEARWEDTGAVAYERSFRLEEDTQFPLELSLTAESIEGAGALTVRAEAFLGGARARPWSDATSRVELVSREMTTVVLKMCDCP